MDFRTIICHLGMMCVLGNSIRKRTSCETLKALYKTLILRMRHLTWQRLLINLTSNQDSLRCINVTYRDSSYYLPTFFHLLAQIGPTEPIESIFQGWKDKPTGCIDRHFSLYCTDLESFVSTAAKTWNAVQGFPLENLCILWKLIGISHFWMEAITFCKKFWHLIRTSLGEK